MISASTQYSVWNW